MAEKKDPHADIAKMSFEAALAELEKIVSRLEQGEVPLAESIEIYERGEALKAHCDGLLRTAEAKIEKIQLSQSGVGSFAGAAPVVEHEHVHHHHHHHHYHTDSEDSSDGRSTDDSTSEREGDDENDPSVNVEVKVELASR